MVRLHLETARPLLSVLWDDTGETAPLLLDDVPTAERIVLPESAPRLAAADARTRAVLDGEALGAVAFGRGWQDGSRF